MADKLKPCPLCGGDGKYHGSYFEDDVCEYVSCTRCNASTPLMYKKGESIEWWNRRPSPWHTGTPTEEGYYLVHLKKYYYKDTCGYMVAKWERNWWRTINVGSYWNLEEEIDAWQKIDPYKED